VQQGEAHRLLDRGVPFDHDVGALPEVVEVVALLIDQADPTGCAGAGQRRGDLVANGGTLTQNKLTLGDPFCVAGVSADGVILNGALASRAEGTATGTLASGGRDGALRSGVSAYLGGEPGA
jgi:hypothetical protein